MSSLGANFLTNVASFRLMGPEEMAELAAKPKMSIVGWAGIGLGVAAAALIFWPRRR